MTNLQAVHSYDVTVEWQHDRKGIMHSDVLTQSIEVVTPPEFPKGIPGIWSPEHLMVAAVNSCLMTTFLSIAENSKLIFTSFKSKGNGKLEMIDGKYMISEIALHPVVGIANADDREKALRIINKAETACLISNSVRSKISMLPEIMIQ